MAVSARLVTVQSNIELENFSFISHQRSSSTFLEAIITKHKLSLITLLTLYTRDVAACHDTALNCVCIII